MKRHCAFALALVAVAFTTQAWAAATVERIEVRLFLAHTGTFSEPIAEGETLWNTVVGEAGVREPSSSILVKVLVSSNSQNYDKKANVQLTVHAKSSRRKSILLKSTGVFSAERRQYVAFWLPETGCEELLLEAEVQGSRKAVKHAVPFRCGE